MRMRSLLATMAIGLVCGAALHADLRRARMEPNLEKRSRLALENAQEAYQSVRQAYRNGDNNEVKAGAAEILESVDLAYTSLKQTGKDPRKSSRWFKHAEIETRDLLRKMDGFQQDMDYTDRPMLDQAKAKVQQVHDDLLVGLMEGKERK